MKRNLLLIAVFIPVFFGLRAGTPALPEETDNTNAGTLAVHSVQGATWGDDPYYDDYDDDFRYSRRPPAPLSYDRAQLWLLELL
ncbi:MAG: hypothetical protein EAZ89_21705 [Bacteroidetes bacterium]|nr:MAG: hypothetical protein EAZ89_21705 [Bacteroidota bacterium]